MIVPDYHLLKTTSCHRLHSFILSLHPLISDYHLHMTIESVSCRGKVFLNISLFSLFSFIFLATDIDDLNEQLNGERRQVQQVNNIHFRFYLAADSES